MRVNRKNVNWCHMMFTCTTTTQKLNLLYRVKITLFVIFVSYYYYLKFLDF